MKSSLTLTFTFASTLVLASCSDRDPVSPRFEAGPLGAVEIGKDEGVQIRSLLSQTIVPSLGTASRYSIELAVRDFGGIHGREIDLAKMRGKAEAR